MNDLDDLDDLTEGKDLNDDDMTQVQASKEGAINTKNGGKNNGH